MLSVSKINISIFPDFEKTQIFEMTNIHINFVNQSFYETI